MVHMVTGAAPPAGRSVLRAALRPPGLLLSFERTQTTAEVWDQWKENQRMDGTVPQGIFLKARFIESMNDINIEEILFCLIKDITKPQSFFALEPVLPRAFRGAVLAWFPLKCSAVHVGLFPVLLRWSWGRICIAS